MSSRRFVAVAATFLVAACSSAPPRSMTLKEMPAINTDAVLADITKLSSDEFGGRKPGTRGEELTVQYLTQQFKAAGAEPGNPDDRHRSSQPPGHVLHLGYGNACTVCAKVEVGVVLQTRESRPRHHAGLAPCERRRAGHARAVTG